MLREVLPLKETSGEVALDGDDEALEELVIFVPLEPRVAVAHVKVVLEEPFVVRSRVDADRQAERRMESAGGDV